MIAPLVGTGVEARSLTGAMVLETVSFGAATNPPEKTIEVRTVGPADQGDSAPVRPATRTRQNTTEPGGTAEMLQGCWQSVAFETTCPASQKVDPYLGSVVACSWKAVWSSPPVITRNLSEQDVEVTRATANCLSTYVRRPRAATRSLAVGRPPRLAVGGG